MTNLPVPVPASVTPGTLITSALWNANVANGINFLAGVPVFSGYQATAQSIANNSWTALTIDTTVLDTFGGHSNTTNPTRYTPNVAGTFVIIGSCGWPANGTGFRRVRITKNGANVQGSGVHMVTGDSGQIHGHVTVTVATANGTTDYFEVQAAQLSGAALNTNANADIGPSLRVFWISK